MKNLIKFFMVVQIVYFIGYLFGLYSLDFAISPTVIFVCLSVPMMIVALMVKAYNSLCCYEE